MDKIKVFMNTLVPLILELKDLVGFSIRKWVPVFDKEVLYITIYLDGKRQVTEMVLLPDLLETVDQKMVAERVINAIHKYIEKENEDVSKLV